MCGICGIIDLQQKTAPTTRQEQVQAMNAKISHRGPDEASQRDFTQASLAMSRLSIIDLSSGTQPIFNEDQSVCVFFNGEIYNYQEIIPELEAKGHQFQTQSDTEVLVHLYEEEGYQMVERLRGMFAFVIYDQKRQQYFFARDRFGEKPFYYHFENGIFSFSSELASLLENQDIPRKLNREALQYFLRAGFAPEPMTLIEGIHTLPPGHFMTVDAQGIQIKPYFQLNYEADPQLKTEEDVVAYVRPHLEKAIKRQMNSDVPLGAFLSGGIDSSTVVANLAKFSEKKINTFTVRFEDSAYDESSIAREVSEMVGTNHHEITVPNEGFSEELFWTILEHAGIPFPDTSAIPTYFISREIRKHVTVALSGDGGDELFAGYPIFQWWGKIHQAKKIPAVARRAALAGLQGAALLPGFKNNSLIRQLTKANKISLLPSKEIPITIMELMDREAINQLYQPGINTDFSGYTRFWDTAQQWTPLRQIMQYRLQYNLPLGMLVKVDRMSMANSLEVRAPFLDPDLFEASTRIPDQFMIKDGFGKNIIRAIMQKELPDSVFNHPKTGFAIPLHKYQNQDYHHLAETLFAKDHPLMEIIDFNEVMEIKEVGLHAQQDTAKLSVYRAGQRLWALMALFGWVTRFDIKV